MLFDSDGTLVDSEAINTEALADELLLHSITEDKTSLLIRYRGWRFASVLVDLGQRHGCEFNREFESSFRARASRYFDDRLAPVDFIEAALRQLTHKKCVASNAPMSKLTQVLLKTGLAEHFGTDLFSAYDIAKFKPDPALFLHAASEMGFDPAHCIVIEDSDVGVEAANSARMKCIHYQPDTDRGIQVEDNNNLIISSMRELPQAIAMLESTGG